MITEIAQIKRFLADHYQLPIENRENDSLCRIVGNVPDSEHLIPIGVSLTPTKIYIRRGLIRFGD